MARILVTEEIAEGGLDRLRAAGHEVDVRNGLSPAELLDAVAGRPRPDHPLGDDGRPTRCSPPGSDLLVVGRAGIGLDNVDVEAATRRGVMVVNAPQANIVSAAEHTMALLLAQARNVPQAHAALVAGRWERSKWEGVELADKTLGIVGLGRIGKLVADRARGFGMRLIAFDPFVSAERGRQLGVELLPLDQVVAESDFLTIHLPKTAETKGLIGRDLLLKAKPTLRVINVARGGIVDEAALADAIRDGVDRRRRARRVRHRADDRVAAVRARRRSSSRRTSAPAPARPRTRPATRSPTWCSWRWPASSCRSPSTSPPPRPTTTCARSCRSPSASGALFGSLVGELPSTVEIAVEGDIGGYDTRIVGLSVLKGLFGGDQRRAGHLRQRPAAGARRPASTSARSARRRRPTGST